MKIFVIFGFFLCFRNSFQYIESPLREKYDGYADDWIFMPDGNDNPQVAILKGEGSDSRRMMSDAVTFHLYTRSNRDKSSVLDNGKPDSIKRSNFDPSHPTKFITHGWKSSALAQGPTNLKNAFLKKGEYNVIIVDWEPLAASVFYLGPMQNTQRVGREAGAFIDFLIDQTGQSLEDIHFIGHSLGAHVAGNTGSAIKHGKLSRITGLDPALPGIHLFETDETRLDQNDAQFVDIIHTCGGVLGYLRPIGDVDFYPNAGVPVQPGCCCLPEAFEACSHGRAYVYYTESINSENGFLSTQCETWDQYDSGSCDNNPVVFMGDSVDRSARGSFWLTTNSEPPYARQTRSFFVPEVGNELPDTTSLARNVRSPAMKWLEIARKIGYNMN